MDPGTLDELRACADRAAAHYARKLRWPDPRDLAQEAVCALVRALPGYDPVDGPLRPWALGIAYRVAFRACAHAGSVVSGPAPALVALQARGVDPEHATHADHPEGLLHARRRADAIRARVRAMLGERGAAFALGVYGDGWKPAEVAAHHALDVGAVYAALHRVRARLREDAELHALWEEAP